VGPSGTGKSVFILCYLQLKLKLKPLIVNNYGSLRDFDSEKHTAIVFDDFSFNNTKITREVMIHLLDVQGEFTFDIKFKSVRIQNNPMSAVIPNLVGFKEISRRFIKYNLKDSVLFFK